MRFPNRNRGQRAATTLLLLLLTGSARAQTPRLPLPERPSGSRTGTEIRDEITSLPQDAREEFLFREIAEGNVPAFLRPLKPVPVSPATTGTAASGQTATIHVTPDYLAVGSDSDYFRMPMTPVLAQRLADLTSTTLPTRRMVNAIYSAAQVKLPPSPIPPSPVMATVPVFWQHEQILRDQLSHQTAPPGTLIAGHKKDVILSITTAARPAPPRVCIYGWHRPDGSPIQPLSTVHKASYADYSHGIRLVSRTAEVDGKTTDVAAVLTDPKFHHLLSDEPAPFPGEPRYPVPR